MFRFLLPFAVSLLTAGIPSLSASTSFAGTFSGAQEQNATMSPGTGVVTVTLNDAQTAFDFTLTFNNLTPDVMPGGPRNGTAGARFQFGTPVQDGGPVPNFPMGVLSGSASGTVDLNGGLSPSTVPADFLASLEAGTVFVNILSNYFPGGEIRAQLRPSRFEENSAGVVLNGGWKTNTDTRASGGTYVVSNAAGDSVTVQFSGDSLALYRRVDVDGGFADVTIDQKPWGSVSFFFPEQRWQIPAVWDHLGDGPHTIVLTVSARQPTGSTGTNVYVDAFEAPIAFTASADQQAALTRINAIRNGAGLPPAQLSAAMDLAAQGHADYLATNGTGGGFHSETFGTPGFIGTAFTDRLNYFGYDSGAGEDASSGSTHVVDALVELVYHRNPFLSYQQTDIGFGFSLLNGNTMGVVDFGNKSGTPLPAARVLVTYPADQQKDVPVSTGLNETPDPLPGKPRPVGYPVSLHITQPANPVQGADQTALSGNLTDSNGNAVPAYFLNRTNDTNGIGDNYFLIPQQPLATSTTYTAHIAGTDAQGNQFDKSWSFTTIPPATVVSVIPFDATPTSIWVQWDTAGPVTATQVDYGTTTAYGSTVVGTPNAQNRVDVNLPGLTPGTTYHYRITATDAQGNTRTSDDMTFATPAAGP